MGVAAQPTAPKRTPRGAAAEARRAARGWREGSPRIGRVELALLAAGAVAVAVLVHWPLILHLGTHVPKDLGDPLAQAWQVAWNGHALLHQPWDWFGANQFWPQPDSLAFSDALVGYAPLGLLAGVAGAVAAYDVAFLLAYALAFAGAYLLARELLGTRSATGPAIAGAVVAGAAFAYAPWRLEQDGHLHVISSGGIPLGLFLLVRGYRRGRPGLVVAGFCVAAWQVSLGWTLGLQLAYLLAVLAVLAAVAWWRAGRPRPARGMAAATIAGAALLAAVSVLLMQPYLDVVAAHPQARRSPADVVAFSGPVWSYLVASDENLVWGAATGGLRAGLENVPEQTLLPGLAIVVLALAGLLGRSYPRRLRVGLGIAALALAILALGFQERLSFLYPYRWLYEVLPGWQAVRVPGRLNTLTSLALALLAAGGAAGAVAAVRSRVAARGRGGVPGAVAPAAVATLLALAVLAEGSGLSLAPPGNREQPRVPAAPAGLAGLPDPQLHLPADRPEDNRRYLLWSTDGFPRMVNGRSSTQPRSFLRLVAAARTFPDRASIARLRAAGVRTVVLHPDRVAGTAWAAAQRRPLEGLGIERVRRGEVLVYDLRP